MISVTEGIKDSLTLAMLRPDYSVWACTSAGAMKALQVPDSISKCRIYADGDIAGCQSARSLAIRLEHLGKAAEVIVIKDGDLNGLITGGHSGTNSNKPSG